MDKDDENLQVESYSSGDPQIQTFTHELNRNPIEKEKLFNLILGRTVLLKSVRNNNSPEVLEERTYYSETALKLSFQQVLKNWNRYVEFSYFFDVITKKNPQSNPYGTELRQKARSLVSKQFVDNCYYEKDALNKNRKLFEALLSNNNAWKEKYAGYQDQLYEARENRAPVETDDRSQQMKKDLVDKVQYLAEFYTRLALVHPLSDRSAEVIDFVKNMDLTKYS